MFVYPARSVKNRLKKRPGGNQTRMLIAAIIVFCILIAVLAFLAPRISRYFQDAGEAPLELGARAGGKAPGRLGKWLRKPFSKGDRAIEKSGSAGRRARAKL
jgi:Family of unknown function (DUF6411)